ncbi:MAG: PatB family C-S lyase [Anaerolineales bacterium]
MVTNFDRPINRRNSDSVKWNQYADDILPLWVADMDFLSPPSVIKALQERVQHGVYGYPAFQERTKDAAIDWLWKQHAWSVSREDLIFLPGVVTGFNLAAYALTNPGEGVLVQTPAYRPFIEVAENTKRMLHIMPLDRSRTGKFYVSKNTFTHAIQSNTRIFMLCNPQNPTGRVFSKEELTLMAETCLENEVIICSDEIHHDIVYPGSKHIPIATLSPEIANQTITLLSPSKTFNIAGLKIAFSVITNPTLKDRFIAAKQGLVSWVNLFGPITLQAAYTEGEDWLRHLLVYLEENRTFVSEFVSKHLEGVSMTDPEGTYLAWLDCRDTGLEDPYQFFLEESKVALNPGDWFGEDGKGYVRLNFGCPREILKEALTRMQRSLESL